MFLRYSKLSRKKMEAEKAFLSTQLKPGAQTHLPVRIWQMHCCIHPELYSCTWREESVEKGLKGRERGLGHPSAENSPELKYQQFCLFFSIWSSLSPACASNWDVWWTPLCDFISSCVVVGGHLGTCSSNRRKVCCLMLAQKLLLSEFPFTSGCSRHYFGCSSTDHTGCFLLVSKQINGYTKR